MFSFNFDYLRKSFIKVTVEDVSFVYGIAYTVNERSVEFAKAPKGAIRIYRETPTDRLVEWAEGSVLKANDMTIQQVQTIHILQETVDNVRREALYRNADGNYDAGGKRITNVGNPLDLQDVVTKQYLQIYSTIGGTDLDPEAIKKILEGVTINTEDIAAIQTRLDALPTKLTQFNNDGNFVQDAAYVHTDQNYTAENKNKLEGLKELQRVDFTDTSPYWTGNTFSQAMEANNVLIALFRKNSDGKYIADGTTQAYIDGGALVINASAPFSGYAIVSGTVSYGNLYELFALLLNEDVAHTYTLDEIIGTAYKEPVYPDKDQLAKATSDFNTNMTNMSNTIAAALTSAEAAEAACKDYYNNIEAKWGNVDPSTFETKTDLTSTLTAYAKQEALAAYLPKANIVSVAALPTTPDANTWYFIQES